jgi:hypothetical protein
MKMNSISRTLSITAIFLFLFTTGIYAQQPTIGGPEGAANLKRLDKNGDGKVSPEEWDGPKDDFSSVFDTNKDGFLDSNECPSPPAGPVPTPEPVKPAEDTKYYNLMRSSFRQFTPQSKDVYLKEFSDIVKKNNPELDARILSAIEAGIAGKDVQFQNHRVEKLLYTSLYAEMRAELKKEKYDIDYVASLYKAISDPVQRRSSIVEDKEAFTTAPGKFLARLKNKDAAAIGEFEGYLNNLFAMSFAYELSKLPELRNTGDSSKLELMFLEAELYFEACQHTMAKADIEKIRKELDKGAVKADIETILNISATAYPKIHAYYKASLK